MSFSEIQKTDLLRRIELCKQDLEELTTSDSEGKTDERADPK